MWLLDVHTRKLVYFHDHKFVEYAILSHTWEEGEVLFQDLSNLDLAQLKKGYQKIDYTCKEAAARRLRYAWIDTCCINKESSAELSEAINSMWKWYCDAAVCFVYLSDLRAGEDLLRTLRRLPSGYPPRIVEALRGCNWLKRGWTLQELLAPNYVLFFDHDWTPLAEKRELDLVLEQLTGIYSSCLYQRNDVFRVSVAARMSWAAHRNTTRDEDQAYCLLGLFEINMPLLYGEGQRAFVRLQKEIIKQNSDRSALVWDPWTYAQRSELFSPHPYGFRKGGRVMQIHDYVEDAEWDVTSRGVRITSRLVPDPAEPHCHFVSLCEWQKNRWETDVPERHIIKITRMGTPSDPSQQVYEIERFLTTEENVRALTAFDKHHESSRSHTVLLLNTSPSMITVAFHLPDDLDVVDSLPKPGWSSYSNELRLYPPFTRDGLRNPHRDLIGCVRLQTKDTGHCITLVIWISINRQNTYTTWESSWPASPMMEDEFLLIKCPSQLVRMGATHPSLCSLNDGIGTILSARVWKSDIESTRDVKFVEVQRHNHDFALTEADYEPKHHEFRSKFAEWCEDKP